MDAPTTGKSARWKRRNRFPSRHPSAHRTLTAQTAMDVRTITVATVVCVSTIQSRIALCVTRMQIAPTPTVAPKIGVARMESVRMTLCRIALRATAMQIVRL